MNLRFVSSILAILLLTGCEEDNPLAPGPQPPANSEEFVQLLATVYRTQDYATFSVLLADDFAFILDEPNPDTGETQWDVATERRIHSRMFTPENIPTVDPSLPTEFWIQSIATALAIRGTFTERSDLYTTAMPPGPYDSNHWTVRSAIYDANVFFQLRGETDFQVTGRAQFTILEDRTKRIGDAGKFLIARWEDLGVPPRVVVDPGRWGAVKSLYR